MTLLGIRISFTILFFCILFAAYFSGIETAVISANKLHLRYLAKNKNRNASIIYEIIRKPDKFLRVVLIGTNIMVIIAASLSSFLAIYYWGEKGATLSTVLVTLLFLIFCEIIPKTIAQNNAENISLKNAKFIRLITILISPLEVFFRIISNFFLKLISRKKFKYQSSFFSKKEIKLIFEIGEKDGALEKREKGMIEKILNLNDTYVKNIMIPRARVILINDNVLIKEAIEVMKKTGLSRVPVYKDNIDNITGFIYAKDFLVINLKRKINNTLDRSDLIHDPYFVSEDTVITNLLKEFQMRKIHIAVVLDKQGKLSGVVTIEDLLEEIFGEIEDEYDIN